MSVEREAERSERRAGHRSSQQRGRIAVVAVALLVTVVLVWWLGFRSSGQAGSPLTGESGEAVVLAGTPGAPVSVGAIDLRNAGKSDIVIDRVSLLDPTTGLRLVGMYAQPEGESVIGAAMASDGRAAPPRSRV